MEIVSIEAKLLDSLSINLNALADEAEILCKERDYALGKWLDNQDVCEILNVTKRTLQNYRDNGTLPYTHIERKIYYKPEDVENLLRASRLNT